MAAPNTADFRTRLQDWLPRLVLAPSFFVTILFVYGFILFTVVLSFTGSKMLPKFTFVGFENYTKLFALQHWHIALQNIAVFASLYIVICTLIGLALAIFLDQKIRGEGMLRPIYLYPMALSFIVTGTAWKWILNPSDGLQKLMHDLGWTSFNFDWLVQSDYAIYCIVIAGVWQSAGFAMALFLAGLRGIDDSIIKAAQIDGASLPLIYWRIILPILRPAMFSIVLVLSHLSIKSFDLVMALTAGGPGFATDVPATVQCSAGVTWASSPYS